MIAITIPESVCLFFNVLAGASLAFVVIAVAYLTISERKTQHIHVPLTDTQKTTAFLLTGIL